MWITPEPKTNEEAAIKAHLDEAYRHAELARLKGNKLAVKLAGFKKSDAVWWRSGACIYRGVVTTVTGVFDSKSGKLRPKVTVKTSAREYTLSGKQLERLKPDDGTSA